MKARSAQVGDVDEISCQLAAKARSNCASNGRTRSLPERHGLAPRCEDLTFAATRGGLSPVPRELKHFYIAAFVTLLGGLLIAIGRHTEGLVDALERFQTLVT